MIVVGSESDDIDKKNHVYRLCCTNTMGDSCHESGVLTGKHEQTFLTDLQDHELA
ncbi:MAG: hypothetical protein ACI92Z_002617 [Paracoccaceae bacterium]|jgi:hypothetical protein